MPSILDKDAAEQIIGLERALGWPDDIVAKMWEKEIREVIDRTRLAYIKMTEECPESLNAMGERTVFPVMTAGDSIYGQGGWDRYDLLGSGEIVFLTDFCVHMDKRNAAKKAVEMGFRVR